MEKNWGDTPSATLNKFTVCTFLPSSINVMTLSFYFLFTSVTSPSLFFCPRCARPESRSTLHQSADQHLCHLPNYKNLVNMNSTDLCFVTNFVSCVIEN